MPIPRIAVLACSMVLLCTLPVRGQPELDTLGDTLLRDADAMHRYMRSIRDHQNLLDGYLRQADFTIQFINPNKGESVMRTMIKVTNQLAPGRAPKLPWRQFPSADSFIHLTDQQYADYQKLYDDYQQYINIARQSLQNFDNVEEGKSCVHLTMIPQIPADFNGPPPESPYVFRSTQASTVFMDPRAATQSISFHDGSSIGSAAASNAGVANGGSNLAVGGSGTSTRPNGGSDCERLQRRSARFEH
ncbi:hypothetical protein SeLEV6574_g08391 [Synchytrium endobioticum]|uniref:Uncharacterized protein n=1 Tax=Synchytrium endobioticum TaxID=286115 RepID=A0A507C2K7_9FUNG|nr:hypothetical protein SeLEV6574_g08391 [Synchytrium endobioticum]